ncbi:MAG: DUF4062 domain-containing protein [Burkholderiaceae bacterium]
MPTPRVFVSSTCYDLRYIRENLRYFIKTLGYEPVLSEDGTVYFDPAKHVHDACISEISSTQMFVLIIGGRYGSQHHQLDKSITNAEYDEAVEKNVPAFALVEEGVYREYYVYSRNKLNSNVDLAKFNFPSVDSLRIFEFIDSVQSKLSNNALVPFKDFADIEAYLKKQWAGLMFDFLTRRSESQRVANTLRTLQDMNERIEALLTLYQDFEPIGNRISGML